MTDDTKAAAKTKLQAAPDPQEGWVNFRVLKFGDGKISTGVHVAGEGDICLAFNDISAAPREIAEELEARHYVEIQG